MSGSCRRIHVCGFGSTTSHRLAFAERYFPGSLTCPQAGIILTQRFGNRMTMKRNTLTLIIRTILLSGILAAGVNAYAQYPTASVLLSNNIEHFSINSQDDYLRVEQQINSVAAKLRDAHQKYPNLSYTPLFSDSELTGFIITGVSENHVADELSACLVQLDVLGKAVRAMDPGYLPNVDSNKLSHVSKKDASR